MLPRILLLVASGSASVIDASCRGNDPVVDLGYAKYEGTALASGINQFLGIRYAAPPTGHMRWRAPGDPYEDKTLRPAKEFAATCIGQSGPILSNTTNEDCLFLNIFTPKSAQPGDKLPVWFFIQGGGYAGDEDQNFNGTMVVEQSNMGIVFVQINYRVGVFGFLASDKIRQNGDLNVGLLDQRKALQWTKKYIHLFGGDPDHVVIHGDSAGAGSVAFHLAAYGGVGEPLFVGAIAESPFVPTHRNIVDMEFQVDALAQNVGCDGDHDVVDCIRSKDTATIQAYNVLSPFPGTAQNPLWSFLPVIDGTFSPAPLMTLFEQGNVYKVPVIIGDDTDEGTEFAPNATTACDFRGFLKANYPKLTEEDVLKIKDNYLPTDKVVAAQGAWFDSSARAYGEATFTCPGLDMSSAMAATVSPAKSWSYRYNVYDKHYDGMGWGVYHVAEQPAIFGGGYSDRCSKASGDCSYLSYNAPMVPIVMKYWISFIKSLDPNTFKDAAAPDWQAWRGRAGQRLKFELNNTVMEDIPEDQVSRCQVWKSMRERLQQ